ncbi:MAG TPA: ATP-binding protein [Roseiflexaceae bacterium]|nr:ATP-binding protein [Roseiflexaceae bacterium]
MGVRHLRTSAVRSYVVVALVLIVATLVLTLATPPLGHADVGLCYLLAVIVVATVFGIWPGLVAALASFLAFNYFFFEPRYTLQVADPIHVFQLATFLAVASIAGTVAGRARLQAQRAQQHASEIEALYALSQAISAEVELDRILAIIAETIRRLLDIPYCAVLLVDHDGHEQLRASAGVASPPLREHMRLIGEGTVRGSLRVSERATGQGFTAHEDRWLAAVAAQAYLAIERAELVARAAHTQALAESDRLKSALLSSVSHDLRTPLAVIKGASSALLADDVSWDTAVRRSFVQTIERETDRLDRLVGNWLQTARIHAGALPIERDWQDLAELVGAAVHRNTRRSGASRFAVTLPPDLPLVWANAALVDQVLTNLLENAGAYAPPGTCIGVSVCGMVETGEVMVTVEDSGPGIPADELERVFEPFFRGAANGASTGNGLGLAICKGIVEAHGGRIWVANRPGGGARFSFTLPARAS